MISVNNLNKSFGELHILKDITEEIHKGEKVVIIGPSGSGKSTFLRCLNLMETPTSGEIIFDGVDITKANIKEVNLLRRKMGMVFQHFNLFPHLTIKKNITLAPVKLGIMTKDEADKKAMALLEKVGLAEKAHAYPSQLSGGQKQRVAIARVLANEPDILLCDEATSALDPETTKIILNLLKTIHDTMGITIVIITHQMSVIQEICTQVAVLDGGVVQECGYVDEVFANPKSKAAKRLLLINETEE